MAIRDEARERYSKISTKVPKLKNGREILSDEETVENSSSYRRKRDQFGTWQPNFGPVVRQRKRGSKT